MAHSVVARTLSTALIRGIIVLTAITTATVSAAAATAIPAADDTDVFPTDPAELVQLLGDDAFTIRERASLALVRIGVQAKPALLAGLQSDDAEIRFRCRRALADVLDVEFDVNLQRFSRGEDTTQAAPPGWTDFQAVAGDDTAARTLFVSMHRDEPALMQHGVTAPENMSQQLAQRCQQIQQQVFAPRGQERPQIGIGSFAALLFIASRDHVVLSERTSAYLHSFSYQRAFQQSIQQGPLVDPLRALLGAWIARGTDSQTKYQNFMLALQYDLHQGLQPALTALKSGNARPHVLQYALRVVGKFGDEKNIAQVTPYLESSAVCGRQRVANEEVHTEVRDVALAILLHLTDQDHAKYGFNRIRPNPHLLFHPGTLGFQDDATRKSALEKWNSWANQKAG